jgi:hypothetical protein
MKSSGLVEKLDDMINPIVVKELRQAVQSRFVVFTLLLYLALQMIILGTFLVVREINQRVEAADFQTGARIFLILQGILMGTCMLLIPCYTGARLALERSDANVDLLFISTLRPRSIIWGKFFSAIVLILLIFSTCAPFMVMTYLMRGIDISTILLVLAIDLLAVITGTQMAIFLTAIPTNWLLKGALAIIGIFILIALFGYALAGSVSLVELGTGLPIDTWEFWGPALAFLTFILAFNGQFFIWSVAVVSPSTTNRALAPRIYTMAAWLVTGIAALAYSHKINHVVPMFSWLVLATMVFCLQVLIAINERDHWGVRVARTIPTRPWLRALAFLFYSGAAGGIVFGVIGLALTLVAGWVWTLYYPSMTGIDTYPFVAEILVVSALYMFCYCMVAVHCRRLLFKDRIKPLFTWVVGLLFLGLGMSLPYILAFIIFQGNIPYYRYDDNPWWRLSNPLAAIIDLVDAQRHRSSAQAFDSIPLFFTSIWATVMALLSVSWFIGQLGRFHPPKARQAKPLAA